MEQGLPLPQAHPVKPHPQSELCCVLDIPPPFRFISSSRSTKRYWGSPMCLCHVSALPHFDVLNVVFLGFLFQAGASTWIQEYQQVTAQAVVKLIFFGKKKM